MNELNLMVGVLATLFGVLVGALGLKKTFKNEVQEETNTQTKLEMQLSYISRGVDDIKLDLKAQDRKINEVVERVAKVEESTKSAHHRIDNLVEKGEI